LYVGVIGGLVGVVIILMVDFPCFATKDMIS
jgi:hypothetical protein